MKNPLPWAPGIDAAHAQHLTIDPTGCSTAVHVQGVLPKGEDAAPVCSTALQGQQSSTMRILSYLRVLLPGAPGASSIQINVPAICPNALPPNITPSSTPGDLTPAVLGAEWLHHPCLLGGPQHGDKKWRQRGTTGKIGENFAQRAGRANIFSLRCLNGWQCTDRGCVQGTGRRSGHGWQEGFVAPHLHCSNY